MRITTTTTSITVVCLWTSSLTTYKANKTIAAIPKPLLQSWDNTLAITYSNRRNHPLNTGCYTLMRFTKWGRRKLSNSNKMPQILLLNFSQTSQTTVQSLKYLIMGKQSPISHKSILFQRKLFPLLIIVRVKYKTDSTSITRNNKPFRNISRIRRSKRPRKTLIHESPKNLSKLLKSIK